MKPGSTGTGDGSSWANASYDLQKMINQSNSGDEVWVAAGEYEPFRRADKYNEFPISYNLVDIVDMAFVLKSGVKIYGGFAGNETLLSQRNIKNNLTILKGAEYLDNSNPIFTIHLKSTHVVISVGNAGNACLDGFTIKDGRAIGYGSIIVNGEDISQYHGGGIYLSNSSPKLQNLQIINNEADYGAAIYSTNAKVTVENVFINGNTANTQGIIYHAGNAGRFGIVNGTVCQNSVNGNIIYNASNYEASIGNSVFWDNNYSNLPVGGYFSATYSCFQGYTYLSNGMVNTTTPYFVDPNNGNYRLQASSPLRNAGYNNNISSTILYDLDWNTRKVGNIDIGAYEYQGKSMAPAQKSAGEIVEDNSFDLNNEIKLSVFPNPATDQLNINSNFLFSKVSIINMLGQTVKEVQVGADKHVMNVSDMAKGLYILKVDTPQGSTTQKIQIK